MVRLLLVQPAHQHNYVDFMEFEIFFQAAVSVVLFVIGGTAKIIWSKLEDMQKNLVELNKDIRATDHNLTRFKVEVSTYYVDKADFKDALRDVKEDLRTIIDKLDNKEDKR